jgi:hypothetical protein
MHQICVETIQACKQNTILRSQHSRWPLNQPSKAAWEPFHGYKLSMTLSNQLRLSKDLLVGAPNGKEECSYKASQYFAWFLYF